MRRKRWTAAITLITAATMLAGTALAAGSTLYLQSDGVPSAALSLAPPTNANLADIDQDGNPGLTIERGGSAPGETNPNRHQEWSFDVAGKYVAVRDLVIWAGEAGLAGNERVEFAAFLQLCSPECVVLDQQSVSLTRKQGWNQVVVNLREQGRTYGTGDSLVLEIVVPASSRADVWFAYGTQDFPSRIGAMVSVEASATTTPTEASTSSSTTTTTPVTTTQADQSNIPAGSGGGDDSGTPDRPGVGEGTLDDLKTNGLFGPSAFDDTPNLRPQEGLMVAYATVSEHVELYWQVALALGILMTVLLLAGFEDTASETDPGRRLLWSRRLNRI